MWKLGRARLLAAGIALTLLAPAAGAQAGSNVATAEKSFQRFCEIWMRKLDAREAANLKKASARKNGSGFIVEYTGYSDQPLRCEAKASGVRGNPFIGKLVYHELRYRRSGSTKPQAHQGSPNVVQTVEVLEIFRFDGSRWVY